MEVSWWERRILCYPAYTGWNCSHIRWPYSGQSEHSTDHHITCTHPGLALVSCIEGRSVGGKKLALYTEIEEGPTPSRLLHKICPFFFDLGGKQQIILKFLLHLLACKKEKKKCASSGNRTRAARVAGEHSTTEPTMRYLQCYLGPTATTLFQFISWHLKSLAFLKIKKSVTKQKAN